MLPPSRIVQAGHVFELRAMARFRDCPQCAPVYSVLATDWLQTRADDRGLEPLAQVPKNVANLQLAGAERGVLAAPLETSTCIDAGIDISLVAMIQAWPHLPKTIQVGIRAMVEAVSYID